MLHNKQVNKFHINNITSLYGPFHSSNTVTSTVSKETLEPNDSHITRSQPKNTLCPLGTYDDFPTHLSNLENIVTPPPVVERNGTAGSREITIGSGTTVSNPL